jgi:hypothetical protein
LGTASVEKAKGKRQKAKKKAIAVAFLTFAFFLLSILFLPRPHDAARGGLMIRWLLVCLAMAAWETFLPRSCMAQTAESPASETKTNPARRDEAAKPLPLDKLKLPPGGILVLVEQAQSALRLFPKMVLLTPEKFQEMMDRISALERQVKSDKKLPSVCKLSGRLTGDAVQLQAEYRFTTDRAGAVVFLGGQGAVITEARWGQARSGQAPFLEPSDTGYSVHADKPGEYVLSLRLQVPVVARTTPTGDAPERGFELGLAGAAVTQLTLDLPAGVKELHWNEFTEKATPGANASGSSTNTGRWVVPLGRVKNLSVSWREPINIPGAGALRTADGQIMVQIQEGQVLTTADLALTDLRGKAREWQVWVPAGAKLEIKTPPGLTGEIIAPVSAKSPHVIRLSEPTSEKFHVLAQVSHARPLTRLPVGPFSVLDAYRQQGTMTIKGTPEAMRGLKPVYYRRGEVVEREVPKEPAAADTIAVFKYWNMLPPEGRDQGKSKKAKGKKEESYSPSSFYLFPFTLGLPPAPLDIELQPIKGAVETQVEHTLQLKQVQDGWQILAVTRIHAKPVHDGVDYLEVQLPRPRPEGLGLMALAPPQFPGAVPWAVLGLAAQPNWPVRVPRDYELEGEDGAAAAELVLPADKGPDPLKDRRAGIKLHRFLSKRFTVVLTGTYSLPGGIQRARLELPRPAGVLDRGAKVTFEVEGNLEVALNERPAPSSLFGIPVIGEENRPAHRQRQTVLWQRTPAFAALAWKPYRPDLGVRTVADVTFRPQNAHVRQDFTLASSEPPDAAAAKHRSTAPLALHVARAIRGLTISGGGKLQLLDEEKQTAWIVPSTEGAALEQFVAAFDFLLPDSEKDGEDLAKLGRQFEVPLLWAEAATRTDTRVRFWCDSGTVPLFVQPEAAAGPWRDQGTDLLPGRNSLPALVVATDLPNPPLRVRLQEAAVTLPQAVVLEQGLIQATVDEDGTEYYRVRFLIARLNMHHIDVEFPAPPAGLMLQVALDHKRLPWYLLEFPSPPGGNVVRLAVDPGLYSHAVVLDVTYRLAAGRSLGSWPWRNSLLPPLIRNAVLFGRVHWEIKLPARLVGFVLGDDAYGARQRDWSGWSSSEPMSKSAELEPRLVVSGSQALGIEPSIVCWRTSLAPLTLVRMPWQIWFLVCSGLVLGGGLGVSLVPWRRLAVGLTALAVALGLGAVSLLWPAALPYVLFGCLPGAALLFLLLTVQWMVHRQYRRQVVFMPGFTRLQSGSSLIRTGGPATSVPLEEAEGRVREGRPREPSTIDAGPGKPRQK